MDNKKNDSNKSETKQEQYDFYKDIKDKKEKVNKNISYNSYEFEKEYKKNINNSSHYDACSNKTNKKSTFFYYAYKGEKDKYKTIRKNINEGIEKYDNILKRFRINALASLILILIIIFLSYFLDGLLGIFNLHGYFLLVVASSLVLIHSFNNIKNTKLFIIVFIFSLIAMFYSLIGMFSF